MRYWTRTSLILSLVGAIAACAPAVAQAGFGVKEKSFEAGTCFNSTCTYKSVEENPPPAEEAFTQAAGHPPWGLTVFELNKSGSTPEGTPLRRVRVDIPPGLAANPQAVPQCPIATFKAEKCPSNTEVGSNELKVSFLGEQSATGKVFNLEQPPGLPLDFGIQVEAFAGLVKQQVYLEGHVSWHKEKVLEERGIPSGDYHEFFEINNISGSKAEAEKSPLIRSKLIFNGRGGAGNFLTLPSACSATTTSYIEVESWTGERSSTGPSTITHTPVGVEGCDGKAPFKVVPFSLGTELTPETPQSDLPDGATTVVRVPQYSEPEKVNTSDVKDAEVRLPEELTLNPAAVKGLEACTPEQIRIGSEKPVICPAGSKLGTVTIETDLPAGSLAGNVYLGNPGGGAITAPPFTIYIDAESVYGVSVRLQGLVNADLQTGRLTATFTENPQLPFSELIMKMRGGAQAPLANPLLCGTAQLEARFTPFTQGLPAALSSSPFTTAGCVSPLPFSLTQSALNGSVAAGGYTSYTFSLSRTDGQQYLAQDSTLLPAGLVGLVPAVALCGEPQAQQGTCPAASQIGSATALVGSGPEPFAFTGPVFLTGPYNGAPFGLSIPISTAVGPFNLGTVVNRASINVDSYTGRVSATGRVPTIVRGVPIRLKGLSISVNRPNFLLNPTNCGLLATESTLTSTLGATQGLSSPFQVSNCSALPFTPVFIASTDANPTKANGADLHVTVNQPPRQANIRSVVTQLPKQLVSRLTTLQQACPEATFAANPFGCPEGSNVGSAMALTPVLPGALTGPAYLVSHGGAAFPDLDVVLEGSGVRVVLVGNTSIKKGVTTSSFAALPDVPVSSFSLTLPMGPHSALAANGALCGETLEMPTTITAQNGAQIKQETRLTISGCAVAEARRCVKILTRKIVRDVLTIRVRTCAAGRLTARGKNLRTAARSLRKAATLNVKMALSRSGVRTLRRSHRLKVRVRVVFVPTKKGPHASASTTVAFKH